MAKELTEEEQCGVRDLEEKFTEHLERYRLQKVAELDTGGKMKLRGMTRRVSLMMGRVRGIRTRFALHGIVTILHIPAP